MIPRRQLSSILLLISALLLASCSSTKAAGGGDGLVFPITEAQADQVLHQAMVGEFGEEKVEHTNYPHAGYQAKLRLLLDVDHVRAFRIPAKGRATGGVVDGFLLEVNRSGTAPAVGIDARDRVLEAVVKLATALAQPVPRADG